ncbi:hypothetical protein [Paenibacillus paeoniae]|uniref:Uncharacterized protein n=1 Tax=Paenibacillus paeoniae TaxID=2292705 RepID=A0A371PJ08_9BACL|nr:hypothetical protein [Paenibacillus paeoniae]REK75905.1 hypothetical protein DX130_02175 [Paenibacillus paeoniae]
MSETHNEAHAMGQGGNPGKEDANGAAGTDGQATRSQDTVNERDGEKGKGASSNVGDQDALAFYAAGLDWPSGLAWLFNEMITSYKNKKHKP